MLGALTWISALPAAPVALAQAAPDQVDEGYAQVQVVPDEVHPRLIRSQQDVFLVAGRRRRWVVSPQVFADYRFREVWIEQISDSEMTSIRLGPDLVAGPVLRAPDGEVWIVFGGSRRPIAGRDAFQPLNLSPEDAVAVDEPTLASYPLARPVGNPPRPWFLAIVVAFLAGAAWVWWRDTDSRRVAVSAPAKGRRLRSSPWLLIGGIAVAGAGLKLYYVSLYPWLPDGADANLYVQTASYLAAGGSLLASGPSGGLIWPTSPLYPIILALSSGALALTRGNVLGWKAVQVGLTVLLVLLVADLARRLYGERAGRAAALVAAVSPLWFYSAELLQYELWLGVFIVAGVWALVRSGPSWCASPGGASNEPERGEGHADSLPPSTRGWWRVGAGLCFGLAALTQLKTVVLFVPAVLYLAWNARHRGRRQVSALAAGLVLFSLPAVVPLAVWGVRNAAVHGEPLLGSTAGGVIFWMGNHAGATGGTMQLQRPDAFYDRLQHYPPDMVSREARAFSELAWEFIRGHPSHFARLGLIKLERFWWTIWPERLGEFIEGRTVAFLGGSLDPTALVVTSKLLQLVTVVTALSGAIWGWRLLPQTGPSGGGAAGRRLVVSAIVLFWLVHLPFIAEPRYRIPIAPLLHVLQGAGLVLLRDWLPRALPWSLAATVDGQVRGEGDEREGRRNQDGRPG